MNWEKYLLIRPLFFFFTFLVSCSTPSDSDIIKAIKESLQERVPVSLARHLTGGQDAIVETIRVIKIGKSQDTGSKKYWPVIVYAKGTCTKMFGGREPFEGEAEYFISENDYGVLIAQPKGF